MPKVVFGSKGNRYKVKCSSIESEINNNSSGVRTVLQEIWRIGSDVKQVAFVFNFGWAFKMTTGTE